METSLSSMIYGSHGPQVFWAMMAFLLIGAFARKMLRLSKRKPASQSSPRKFSILYWLRDNGADLGLGFALAFICVRFPFLFIEPLAKTHFPELPVHDVLMFGSVVIGFGIDSLAERLSQLLKLKA
jgi:hypothetical protein